MRPIPVASLIGGAAIAATGGGGAIVPTTGILVANRTQYQTNAVSTTQPSSWIRTHYAHPDGAISAIQCLDINRYLSGVATGTAGGVHTIKRFIEYPAGVFSQFLWSGLPTVSVAASARLLSDPIAGLTIPAGAKFWERTVYLTTGTFPIMELPDLPTAIGVDDGSASGDFGNSGTISPGSSVNVRGCQALIGTVNATNARSFVLLGDSLTLGSGDITSVGAKDGSGYVARILDQHGYPYMKWCKGGQQVADHVTVAATLNADLAMFNFSDIIIQSGLNDLSLGSRTKLQVENDLQTLLGQTNIVGKRAWKTTITPRSDTTDAYATTVNQTPKIDGNMADLTGLNADIRAGLAGFYGIIEAADAAMSARDSNIHKAPPAGTTDGTHLNSTRAALVAAALSI